MTTPLSVVVASSGPAAPDGGTSVWYLGLARAGAPVRSPLAERGPSITANAQAPRTWSDGR